MRWLLQFCALFLVCAMPAHAQRAAPAARVALVIGESAYDTVSPLANPAADAKLVAQALTRAGFDVRLGLDLDKAAFEAALDDFAHDAQQAEVAAVYFAGHGFEAGGRNWLVPVDAAIARPADLPRAAVPFEAVARSLAGAKVKIVALDACRDNPFAARVAEGGAINRGLGEVELDGFVVMYAAAAGAYALDGTGNSPFAQSFARWISEQNVDLRLLAGRIRDDVIATTSGKQRPFVAASLSGSATMLTPAPVGRVRGAVSAPQRPSAYFDFVRQVQDPSCFQTGDIKCVTTWATLNRDGKLLTYTDDAKARLWDTLGAKLERALADPEESKGWAYARPIDSIVYYGGNFRYKNAKGETRDGDVQITPLDGGPSQRGGSVGIFENPKIKHVMEKPLAALVTMGDDNCPILLLGLRPLKEPSVFMRPGEPSNVYFGNMDCDWAVWDDKTSRIIGQFNWRGGNAVALKAVPENTDVCVIDVVGTDAAFNGAGGFHIAIRGDIVAYDSRCRELRRDRLHQAEIPLVHQLDAKRMLSRSVDGVVKVWGVANGKVERELTGLPRAAKIVSYSGKGDAVLILNEDRRLYIWSGEPRLGAYVGPSTPVCSGMLSDDSNTLYALRCDGALEVWRRRSS